MGKFNNTNKINATVPQSVILHSIAVEISNQLLQPIWLQIGIREEKYQMQEDAIYLYNVETIEQEIINRIDNEKDVLTNESLLQIIKHEDSEPRNLLVNSETTAYIENNNTISIGNIVQQIELIIASRSLSSLIIVIEIYVNAFKF